MLYADDPNNFLLRFRLLHPSSRAVPLHRLPAVLPRLLLTLRILQLDCQLIRENGGILVTRIGLHGAHNVEHDR